MTGLDSPTRRYDVVLFDLLTALLDSWTLWNAVAGSPDAGARWRAEYLRITYRTGPYRPYEELVAKAALATGLPARLSGELAARYHELQPWPDVAGTLERLRAAGVRLGAVTNCSKALGRIAADRLGTPLDLVITAEDAGFYKPEPPALSPGDGRPRRDDGALLVRRRVGVRPGRDGKGGSCDLLA